MFDIYNNKKVLITGHTGFKGSWLTLWLLKNNASIIGCSLEPKNKNDNFALLNISTKIDDCRVDIRDYKKIDNLFNEKKPEFVFHLAAQPLVLDSYSDPLLTFESNTQGTLNVLESFRNSKTAKYLIIATTDKVYQNHDQNRPFNEDDALGGFDPYSSSKAVSELIVQSYYDSFFKNTSKKVVTVRAGNVIGGGDWSDNRIVPDCIKAIENRNKIIIRNPDAVRPWQHVLDPIGGYLLLGEKMISSNIEKGAWNFGPNDSEQISVLEMVKQIIKYYGKGEYKILNTSNKLKESKFLSLDVTKANQELGWQSVFNFNETIDLTVDWYKKYISNNVYKICSEQINLYEKLWKSRN